VKIILGYRLLITASFRDLRLGEMAFGEPKTHEIWHCVD
jgi:hypothetical protein